MRTQVERLRLCARSAAESIDEIDDPTEFGSKGLAILAERVRSWFEQAAIGCELQCVLEQDLGDRFCGRQAPQRNVLVSTVKCCSEKHLFVPRLVDRALGQLFGNHQIGLEERPKHPRRSMGEDRVEDTSSITCADGVLPGLVPVSELLMDFLFELAAFREEEFELD